jgi:hypothetical protein
MRHTDVTASGLCVHTHDDGEVSPALHLGDRHECSTVAEVVTACLAALPGIDGAAVAVMTGPDARQTVHASDGVIAAVEDLQFLQGQGPCWDAFATASPVLVDDLRQVQHRLRWPAYLPAVTALGVSAIFALPLAVTGVVLGVLDLYRTTPGPLPAEQLAAAGAYATAAGYALLNTEALTADPELTAQRWHRDEIYQAVGFVIGQLSVNSDEALLLLRAHSYARNRDLDDVCHDVVAGRLRIAGG